MRTNIEIPLCLLVHKRPDRFRLGFKLGKTLCAATIDRSIECIALGIKVQLACAQLLLAAAKAVTVVISAQ